MQERWYHGSPPKPQREVPTWKLSCKQLHFKVHVTKRNQQKQGVMIVEPNPREIQAGSETRKEEVTNVQKAQQQTEKEQDQRKKCKGTVEVQT